MEKCCIILNKERNRSTKCHHYAIFINRKNEKSTHYLYLCEIKSIPCDTLEKLFIKEAENFVLPRQTFSLHLTYSVPPKKMVHKIETKCARYWKNVDVEFFSTRRIRYISGSVYQLKVSRSGFPFV